MSTQGAHDAAPEPAKPTPEDTPPKVASVGRRYSGMCSADRVLERYARLIEAGIDVFGTQGYASAKIKTLCQRAGLSERYFYESFESREDLLSTVYDHLATAMLDALKSAFKAPAKDLAASVKAGTAGYFTRTGSQAPPITEQLCRRSHVPVAAAERDRPEGGAGAHGRASY